MPQFRAIHTIELKQNVDAEVFEDFMSREYLPATGSLPGCLRVEFLKGYKGDFVGVAPSKHDYAWVTLWESVEAKQRNLVKGRGTSHARGYFGSQRQAISLCRKLFLGRWVYCRSSGLISG